MDIISKKLANGFYYAYHEGHFWRWDEGRKVWKESHLMARKYDLNREYDKLLTPETFLSDPTLFIRQGDAVRLPDTMMKALQAAQPCQNAPIDPVEEPLETLPDTPATSVAPSFDFSALGDLSGQAAEADRQFDQHYSTAQDEYLISCTMDAGEVVTCPTKRILSRTPSEARRNCPRWAGRAASPRARHAAASAPCGRRRTTISACRRPTAAG